MHPDGLEAVAERTDWQQLASGTALALDDYALPLPLSGTAGEVASVAAAGILGTLAVFVLAFVMGRGMRLRTSFSEANRD